jgi:hypothetical protein
LSHWQNFYVIVGSSAGALIGLTFIVITIAADDRHLASSASARLSGLRVFITPTAVHFGSVLWLAALMSIPGQTAVALAILLAGTGVAGLAYCVLLLARMLDRSLDYRPFVSDWIWSAVLPTTAYLALAASGVMVLQPSSISLYTVAGVSVLLLLIGIHNAWDVVVWMTTERHAHRERQHRGEESAKGSSGRA